MFLKITSKFLVFGFAAIILSSCSGEEPESLMSPCVGADNSPCGEKRPANPHLVGISKA